MTDATVSVQLVRKDRSDPATGGNPHRTGPRRPPDDGAPDVVREAAARRAGEMDRSAGRRHLPGVRHLPRQRPGAPVAAEL